MKTVTHELAALIGPNGELSMGWCNWEQVDEGLLWDCTVEWPCDEQSIRKAVVHVTVPVLGEQPKIGLVGTVEAKEAADDV